jgi:hydroxymethylpyrimidine/phosphomethylpyrimidine kinase
MQQSPDPARVRSVLSIAGSDSGGGAGIQADLKTIAAHGLHGTCAITAVTAQNTRGVTAVHTCPPQVVRAQIDALFDDFDIAAVKIGMLAGRELIEAVAAALAAGPALPVVLDPVMVASSGARLLEADAIGALRERLFPLCTLVTPNLPEAALLLGRPESVVAADMAAAAAALLALGAPAVLLKGGHRPGGVVLDRLQLPGADFEFLHPRLAVEGHGTGCTLSAAVACGLARGDPLPDACRAAGDYVHGALRAAYRPGRARLAVLGHDWRRLPAGDRPCPPAAT